MQATGKGQDVVETFNLQGQGLYPLSDQGKQALLNAVNQTLTAQGTSVANITLGQVTVRVVRQPLHSFSFPVLDAERCKFADLCRILSWLRIRSNSLHNLLQIALPEELEGVLQ